MRFSGSILLFIVFFIMMQLANAAESGAASDRMQVIAENDFASAKLRLLKNGDIMSIATTGKPPYNASYFSTAPSDKSLLLQHIQFLLQSAKPNKALAEYIKHRLPRHPYLKRDNFEMRFTASDGKKYGIIYQSSIESNMYIIHFRNMNL